MIFYAEFCPYTPLQKTHTSDMVCSVSTVFGSSVPTMIADRVSLFNGKRVLRTSLRVRKRKPCKKKIGLHVVFPKNPVIRPIFRCRRNATTRPLSFISLHAHLVIRLYFIFSHFSSPFSPHKHQ